MHLLYKIIFLSLLISLSFTANTEVYKWLDETGRTYFSDQPPLNQKSENIEIAEIVTYSSAFVVDNDAVIEQRSVDDKTNTRNYRRKKVVIYSAAWCGVCTTAKNYFNKNKIPFREFDIDKSRKGKIDFKKLKARGVPVILVGKKRLNGFNISKFESIYRS